MANIKLNRKEFEKHVKLTKEIEEKISLFGTSLESSGEDEIEIEVYPNRPDLLSLHGFLRAFKAFIGKETGLKKYKVNKPEKDYSVRIDASVKEVRPYTACAIVKGLELNDEKIKEIIDVQEKLHTTIGRNRKKLAIGIYPLEKISLPIRYEARKPEEIFFQPLEFSKEMNARDIILMHPAGKEYSHLLEKFNSYPVFIDSKNKVLSMPPIINSHETGKITEKTKEVFIECSGSDFNALKKTLNIIVAMLADMNGKIFQMTLDYGKEKATTPDLSPSKIKLSAENAGSLLGIKISEKEAEKLLLKMGCEYKNSWVYYPAWRTDIMHEVDIIEDIAIAYGYNNFSPNCLKSQPAPLNYMKTE